MLLAASGHGQLHLLADPGATQLVWQVLARAPQATGGNCSQGAGQDGLPSQIAGWTAQPKSWAGWTTEDAKLG